MFRAGEGEGGLKTVHSDEYSPVPILKCCFLTVVYLNFTSL